jgi:hypothetical protein
MGREEGSGMTLNQEKHDELRAEVDTHYHSHGKAIHSHGYERENPHQHGSELAYPSKPVDERQYSPLVYPTDKFGVRS